MSYTSARFPDTQEETRNLGRFSTGLYDLLFRDGYGIGDRRFRPVSVGLSRNAGNCFLGVRSQGLVGTPQASGQVLQILVLVAPTGAIAHLQPHFVSPLGL